MISRSQMGSQMIGGKMVKKMKKGGDVMPNASDIQSLMEMMGPIKKGAGGIPVVQALGNIQIGGKRMSSGGKVSSRGDGLAQRGRTRGRIC